MNRLGRFRYWLGSARGALWYFGICYALIGAAFYMGLFR